MQRTSSKSSELGLGVRACKGLQFKSEVQLLKSQNQEEVIQKIAQDFHPEVYSFSNIDDLEYLKSIGKPPIANSLKDLVPLINCKYLLVTRFHALISAIALSITPIILVSFVPNATKVGQFASRFSFANQVNLLDPSYDKILRLILKQPIQQPVSYLKWITEICKIRALAGMDYILKALKKNG